MGTGTAITTTPENVFNKFEVLEVSKYFEDPEGVTDLIYSLADLSDDDKKIVTVSLAATAAADGDTDGDIEGDEIPAHEKSVTGKTYLNISGIAPGSVTLMLTVKDGLPEGVTSQSIQVMVRDANAPPVIDSAVLDAAAYQKMSRIQMMRIRSDEPTMVMIPMGAFSDGDNDALTITAEVGGTAGDDATVAASVPYNKARLDVKVDGNYLVLTPKRGNNAFIPVRLKAADRYGASVMTGNDATTNPPTGTILVEINTAPMNVAYSGDPVTDVTGVTEPEGVKAGDPIKLAHITDTTFSVASNAEATAFITLDTFFVDPDEEDAIDGTDRICAFDTSPADQEYATVAFNTAGEVITVHAKKRGMFDLSVTCTDLLGEMVTDTVKVTIIQ